MAYFNETGQRTHYAYSCGHQEYVDWGDGGSHGVSYLCPKCQRKEDKELETKTPIKWLGINWWRI